MRSGPPFSPSNGLVLLVPRIVPPCFESPRTACRSRVMKSSSTSPRHPCRKPTSSASCESTPLSTAPRMTAFKPGESPPLVSMPIFIRLTPEICCGPVSGESRARGSRARLSTGDLEVALLVVAAGRQRVVAYNLQVGAEALERRGQHDGRGQGTNLVGD